MRNALPFILGTVMFVAASAFGSRALAAVLELDKIGASNFSTGASTWTYYGTNPVFQGTASPSAMVSLSIDSVAEASATADTSGSWVLIPTSLTNVGSYSVRINSGTENVSFTLNIASSSSAATTSASTTSGTVNLPETLPETGSEDVLMLLGIGGVLLIAGMAGGAWLRD